MAQEVKPWQPSTTLSLEQRALKSREIIGSSTSPPAALKAAKQLVGCYPHARPPEPETYAAALAAVLTQYPLGVVTECVDPRAGLAREREFTPTVAAVVSWCDKRLAWHHSVAAHKPRERKLAGQKFTDEQREQGAAAIRGLRQAMVDDLDMASMSFADFVELGRKVATAA